VSRPVKYKLQDRPICEDCQEKHVHVKDYDKKKKKPIYRKTCYTCHTARRAKKRCKPRLVLVRDMAVTTAHNNLFETPSEHKEHLARMAGGYR
tara:strand:+ start:327 stop:605 length:279 start_codon:yes stop_codon:yes gene_type:complete